MRGRGLSFAWARLHPPASSEDCRKVTRRCADLYHAVEDSGHVTAFKLDDVNADGKHVLAYDCRGQLILGAERRNHAVGLEQEHGKRKADANLEDIGSDRACVPVAVAAA